MAARAVAASAVLAPIGTSGRALRPAKAAKPTPFVSNGNINKTSAMRVWNPLNNKFFETFSYLPALSNSEISKQVDYIVRNGMTPCLEFSAPETAYVTSDSCVRMGTVSSNYVDNRYWTMWKLPMFGCTDGDQVLREVALCTKAFPNAYIRLVAFDSVRQVQAAGFLVHRPVNAKEHASVENRSVAGDGSQSIASAASVSAGWEAPATTSWASEPEPVSSWSSEPATPSYSSYSSYSAGSSDDKADQIVALVRELDAERKLAEQRAQRTMEAEERAAEAEHRAAMALAAKKQAEEQVADMARKVDSVKQMLNVRL